MPNKPSKANEPDDVRAARLLKDALCPLLAFFDFAAAFPSVLHSWSMIVLEMSSTPDGFQQIVKTMYSFVKCYATVEGKRFFAYLI